MLINFIYLSYDEQNQEKQRAYFTNHKNIHRGIGSMLNEPPHNKQQNISRNSS